jgi:hypothetical protein
VVSDRGYVEGDLLCVSVAGSEMGGHLEFHLGEGPSSDSLEFEFSGSFGGGEGVLGYSSGVNEVPHSSGVYEGLEGNWVFLLYGDRQ